MSANPKSPTYRSLNSLAKKLRKDLNGIRRKSKTTRSKGISPIKSVNFVLIFAHNGVGKTRLSMDFKEIGKRGEKRDTLYFNAFTEDLFDWDNDFENDQERKLKFKSHSQFFTGLDGMGIENQIRPHLQRYADFDFTIDYVESEIIFHRDVIINGRSKRIVGIKISRGEENIFIWCFFLAIAQMAIEAEKGEPYDWVKFIYIDDPISSLDEHNSITVASQLAKLLKIGKDKMKVVISTHHGLFFNVMFNELKSGKNLGITKKSYILHRPQGTITYSLRDTGETPFLHHIFALSELQKAKKSGVIYPYHFNTLRSILEKTAIFFGSQHISTCFDGIEEKALYSRFLNVKSHTKYSIYEPEVLSDKDKKMFGKILDAFLARYPFNTAL
jgi:wobble nucleotide-excising tRNase